MLRPLDKLDIVLSVFNQEQLIERVLYGIFKNTTTPFNMILIFDGCTDNTKPRALRYIKKCKPTLLASTTAADTPNVFETKANNTGFKLASSDYMITVQDDMVIQERGWERRLTYPLRKFDDVLAVSARIAQDITDITTHSYSNRAGKELHTLSRDTFAIRDVINRGPIAFRMEHLKALGYLNENYAPSDLDDADLSLRAWEQNNWRVGAFWIHYLSRLEWGKARAKDSTMNVRKSISKNSLQIAHDHKAYIESGIKHTQNINIQEQEIDYHHSANRYYFFPLHYPLRVSKRSTTQLLNKMIAVPKIFLRKIVSSILASFGYTIHQEAGIKKTLLKAVGVGRSKEGSTKR